MTKPGTYRHVGKRSAAIRAADLAWYDLQPVVTSCGLCDWQHTGTAAEGRVQAAEHRASAHPTVKAVRRRRGSLQRWAVSDDSFRQDGMANAESVAAMHRKREEEAA